jgi:homopolymeric O-antigen transport system permease protein
MVLPVEQVIRPTTCRLRIGDLWQHRPVLRVLAVRDFKVKFKQSVIGPVWLLIQPTALLAGFVVGFSNVVDVDTGVPYSLFVLVALSAWIFFSISFNMGAASLITNWALVRRTPCPRVTLPLASLLTNLPALAIPSAAALVVAAANDELSLRALLLPVAIAWLLVLTGATVLLFAGVAARYRDVVPGVPFILQIGIFAAPIGYSLDQLSGTVAALVSFNPLTGIIETLRWMMLDSYSLPADTVLIGMASTGLIAVVAWQLFGRLEVAMADFI